MSIQYKWNFGPLKVETVNNIPNVVTGINFMCIAQDLDRSQTARGQKSGFAPVPDINTDNFVSIDNLTTSVIQEWINQCVPKTKIEELCASFLEKELLPPVQLIDLNENTAVELSDIMSTPGFVPVEPLEIPSINIAPKLDPFVLSVPTMPEILTPIDPNIAFNPTV